MKVINPHVLTHSHSLGSRSQQPSLFFPFDCRHVESQPSFHGKLICWFVERTKPPARRRILAWELDDQTQLHSLRFFILFDESPFAPTPPPPSSRCFCRAPLVQLSAVTLCWDKSVCLEYKVAWMKVIIIFFYPSEGDYYYFATHGWERGDARLSNSRGRHCFVAYGI